MDVLLIVCLLRHNSACFVSHVLSLAMPDLPSPTLSSSAVNSSQTTRPTMPPTPHPRDWRLHIHLCALAFVYAFASTSRRVLHLPRVLPTVFDALHRGCKYSPQREGCSLVPPAGDTVGVFVLRTPPLDTLPSSCRSNSIKSRSSNTHHLSRSRRRCQLRIHLEDSTRVGYTHTQIRRPMSNIVDLLVG